MALEGMPRAVIAIVLSWGIALAVWVGAFMGAAVLSPRDWTLGAAVTVGAAMALLTNGALWVFAKRQVERHLPDGNGRVALLVIAGGMALFMIVAEGAAVLAVAFSR
jgi:hypothetical protein